MTEEKPGGTAPLADRTVARIGYGVMQLAGPGGRPAPPRGASISLLRRAVELGVDHLDTAQFYGVGVANDLLHAALAPYPDDLMIVTKVGADEDGQGIHAAQRPAELRASVEANLATLGVDRLDVVNLRRMDQGPGIIAEGDQVVDLDDQLAELVALRDEGLIGAIGLSHVDGEQLRRGLPVGLVCVQNTFSVLDRTHQPELDECAEHGIAWVPFFPLGGAFPGVPKVTDDPVVRATAERLGATPSQVGLAWLLAHRPGILLIPGTTSEAHLEENLGAGDVHLDAEAVAALDGLAEAGGR